MNEEIEILTEQLIAARNNRAHYTKLVLELEAEMRRLLE